MTEKPVQQPEQRGSWARFATALSGLWLVISAFSLPQPYPLWTHAWVVGLGVFLTGLWALRDNFARWLSGALAVWLAGATFFALQVPSVTYWNNLITGAVIVLLSMIKTEAA
jgi:hypothetical protein